MAVKPGNTRFFPNAKEKWLGVRKTRREEVAATEKAVKALEKAGETLEKYQKNKTLVPPEQLAGKYKKAFGKLEQQLKEELEEYLRLYILDGLQVRDDEEGQQVIAEINQAFKEAQIGRQVGRAAFKEFDLEKIKWIAQEYRQKVDGIYKAYFDRHTCLYAAGPSWDPDNPQLPLIYNDIADKFYDGAAGGWISKGKPPGTAMLIFVKSENRTTEQKEDKHEQTGECKEI